MIWVDQIRKLIMDLIIRGIALIPNRIRARKRASIEADRISKDYREYLAQRLELLSSESKQKQQEYLFQQQRLAPSLTGLSGSFYREQGEILKRFQLDVKGRWLDVDRKIRDSYLRRGLRVDKATGKQLFQLKKDSEELLGYLEESMRNRPFKESGAPNIERVLSHISI